jgi:uroporphyrinogen-III synthase
MRWRQPLSASSRRRRCARTVCAASSFRTAAPTRKRCWPCPNCSCYRRGRPRLDPSPLLKLWEQGRLDAVTLTSSEGLRNFFDMVGRLGQAWLRKTPAFVPHVRIAEQAQALGLAQVIPTGPGDEGLMIGLVQYFASNGNSATN